MNILLIIFNKDVENPDVFKDRIKALGDTFYIFDNMAFVETESSTKEAYEKISSDIYENTSMLILYVRNEMFGFWGRMNVKLWTWLDEKEEKTKNGLEQNYIEEINQRDLKILDQKELIESLKSENEDYQKSIENLYQQIHSLEEKLRNEMIE